jgi:hypothetical protein
VEIPPDVSTASLAIRHYQDIISDGISNGFKFVLENKHLYQNYEINIQSIDNIFKNKQELMHIRMAKERCRALLGFRWDDNMNIKVQSQPIGDTIYYSLPTVKMYCAACKRIEPFNPLRSYDVLKTQNGESYNLHKEQLFLLIYNCQSCKGLPEVFLIRRKDWKLNLAGRSPMEIITVEKDIPKNHSKHISDAKLAFNSGHILAGLFFLRVFIEQYAKSVVNVVNIDKLKTDEIIKLYADSLPTDFKDRFPSLYKIYSDLSISIHNATADEQLFSKCISDISDHFEAKRIFKIKDSK